VNPADFARLFDAQNHNFTEDIACWLALADRYGDPVLELGCGGGRVLLPLAQAGHRIHGVDNNPHMLERLTRRLQPEVEGLVSTQLSDLTDLHLADRYPLILAPCNTLAGFGDEALSQLLVYLSAALTERGALAFEAPPSHGGGISLAPDEVVDAFHEPAHDVDVQVSASQSTDPDRQISTVTWRYDEMKADGAVERYEHRAVYHLRTPSTYTDLLGVAGFSQVAVWGDYDGGPYTDESELMLVVARPG